MDYEDDQRRRLRQQHQQHPSSLIPNRPRTMTAPSSSGSSSSSSHYYDPSQNFARLSMAPPVPVLPANLLPGGGGSGGKRLGQQSVYVDNASLLFGQARPDLPPSLARVPPRPPVLVPIPAGRDSELDNHRPLGQAMMSSSSSSSSAPPPPLPLKPSMLRQTEGSASIPTFPPPNLPPKPFGSDLAPTSFYSAAVAPITPPLPLRSNAQDPAPAPPIPASIPAPTPVYHPPQPPTPAIPFHSRPPSPLPTTQTPSDEGARPDFTIPSRRPTPVSSLLPSSSSPAPPLHPHPPRVSRSPARSLPSTPSPRPARASPPLPPPMPLPPPQQSQSQPQQQQQPASTPSVTTTALAPLPRSASPGEFEYPFYTDEEARQMEEDEALARRLAAEEEAEFADAIAESPLGTPAWASSTSSASTSPRWPAEHHPSSYTGAGAGGGGAVGVARRAYSTTDLPSSQGGGGGLAAVLEAGVPPRSAPMPNRSPNQFVEPELLLGVSFGFGPPPMNVQRAVMQSPIPTIISLPYGKAPPMHIQAGSWKQMLRLLAKLSGTRIEPAVESVAMTSGTLKLRVVVQFIKNHHASNDWRTVLYLTIDHPTPPKLQSSVVRPNDPNVLPFSYTLSSLPTLLRDGHDSSLSKYYAIPETPSMPLPHLPLTLPDLAVYLAGALEESRKVPVRDAAGGFKRLSKLVDAFYPAEAPTTMMADDDDEPRRGWKRFIRRSKQPAQQSVNANMYELVTPFPFVAMSAQTPGGY